MYEVLLRPFLKGLSVVKVKNLYKEFSRVILQTYSINLWSLINLNFYWLSVTKRHPNYLLAFYNNKGNPTSFQLSSFQSICATKVKQPIFGATVDKTKCLTQSFKGLQYFMQHILMHGYTKIHILNGHFVSLLFITR